MSDDSEPANRGSANQKPADREPAASEPVKSEPGKGEPGRTKPGFFRRLFTRSEEVPATESAGTAADAAAAEAPGSIVSDDAPGDHTLADRTGLDHAVGDADVPVSAYLLPDEPPVEPQPAPASAPEIATARSGAPSVDEPKPPQEPPQEPAPEPAREPASAPVAFESAAPSTGPVPQSAVSQPLAPQSPAAEPAGKRSWWSRLRDGLARSSSSIGTGISDIFTKRKLDDAMLEDLEDVLIRADLGVATATRICEAVGRGRYDKDVSPDEVKTVLASEVERVLAPFAAPIAIEAKTPFVILVVGVNGSGKTTTIGKLAAKFTAEGQRVMLAAGDTFRAAAIAQLTIWGERIGCAVVAREQGSDPAGLAFEAIETARAQGADILLMDTAGRLQNRTELMAELEKIIRVMRKLDAAAPHAVLLVLDATVGQNAMSQVEIFGKVAGVTGLVMTKLDGTARGGILVAITEKFKLPVHFIGVGETQDDLEPFAARDFAAAIAGLDRAGPR